MLTQILIITDQSESVPTVLSALRQEEEFEIATVRGLPMGLTSVQRAWPALVVLYLVDEDESLELCRTLKADHGTRSIPIIILARAAEAAGRIAALEAGADDCVRRQCHPREIILRIKAVLRRGKRPAPEEQLVRGPIRLDPARFDVAVDERLIRLTAVEFKLLRALVKQPGQVQTREILQSETRGIGEIAQSRTIDTHMRRLRRKLGRAAYLVETVRGAGYRLRPI